MTDLNEQFPHDTLVASFNLEECVMKHATFLKP